MKKVLSILLLSVLCSFLNASEEGKNKISIGVVGEVIEQGHYFMPEGVTVLDAINKAKGLALNANPEEIKLLRIDGEAATVISINLRNIESGETANVSLMNYDAIYVLPSLDIIVSSD